MSRIAINGVWLAVARKGRGLPGWVQVIDFYLSCRSLGWQQQKEYRMPMCVCKEALLSAAAERELRFLRPDKPRLVLGNGRSLLFQVVCVTENSGGREVALCCDCCHSKWVAKINGRYELTPL